MIIEKNEKFLDVLKRDLYKELKETRDSSLENLGHDALDAYVEQLDSIINQHALERLVDDIVADNDLDSEDVELNNILKKELRFIFKFMREQEREASELIIRLDSYSTMADVEEIKNDIRELEKDFNYNLKRLVKVIYNLK